jgi:hypothetical protein
MNFSSFVDCCLAAQMADFGQNGPKWTSPWRHRFWRDDGQFLNKKNMIVTIGSKANECINIFLIATFFEFLAASDAIVADESGVRSAQCRNFEHEELI